MPFENIQALEFIFKSDKADYYPALLHKKFETREKIPIETGDTSENFVVKLPLSAEETMKLTVGEVYMDTRIVLTGGVIPETKIVKINVYETLFSEVYNGD